MKFKWSTIKEYHVDNETVYIVFGEDKEQCFILRVKDIGPERFSELLDFLRIKLGK